MNYRHPDRHERDRDDWDRGHSFGPRSQSYRPTGSEDSRDARRDSYDRRESRDRPYPPPLKRVDSNVGGQASPSVGSLASSPREPPERTPVKSSASAPAARLEQPQSTNSPQPDAYKAFSDALCEQVLAAGKKDVAKRTMEAVEQQQKRLVPGLSDTASESKIWRDKLKKADIDYKSACKKSNDLNQPVSSALYRLIHTSLDKRVKASATPTLNPEQEATLAKKLQEAIQPALVNNLEIKIKTIQENLEGEKEHTHELVQEIKQELKQELQQQISDGYAQKLEAIEQSRKQELDGLKQSHSQELDTLKQSYSQGIDALKESFSQELEQLRQGLRDEFREELKVTAEASDERVEAMRRLNTQHAEDFGALKEQLAAQQTPTQIIPAEELQEFRDQMSGLTTKVSDLSVAVDDIQKQGMKPTMELDPSRPKLEYAESQRLAQSRHSSVDPIHDQSSTIREMKELISSLEKDGHTVFKRLLEGSDQMRASDKKLDLLSERMKEFDKRLQQVEDRQRSVEPRSVEPSSLHGSPFVDRKVQLPVDSGLPKKAATRKDLKATEREVKEWVIKLNETFGVALDNHTKDLAALKTQCDTTSVDVNGFRESLESYRLTMNAQGERFNNLDIKIDTVDGKTEQNLQKANMVHTDFEMRISNIHGFQAAWKSHDFTRYVIQQIQEQTPGMLQHNLQTVMHRLEAVELWQRSIMEATHSDKRRKTPNGAHVPGIQNQVLYSVPSNGRLPPNGHQQQQNGQQPNGYQAPAQNMRP